MNKHVKWIVRTALLLALLVALQALTKGFGQLVTGSCVNALLAISVLLGGIGCGLTVAIISPVLAFVLGIAPNFITVLPIMLANSCYVALLHLFLGKSCKPVWKQPVALVVAAFAKFGVLYVLVVTVICDLASGALLGKKLGDIIVLAPPMLKLLSAMFSWPQLFTALIGGGIALLLLPVLRKGIRK